MKSEIFFHHTVSKLLVIEFILAGGFGLIGFLARASEPFVWFLFCYFLLHSLLFLVPLAAIKGMNFIIYDAPPNSLWKYYGFLVIAIAVFYATVVDNHIAQFVSSL